MNNQDEPLHSSQIFEETTLGLPDYDMEAKNYVILAKILASHDAIKLGRGAEIGVLYGDTSLYLLHQFRNLYLFSVDPYLPYDEPNRTAADLARYEGYARKQLEPFGSQSIMVKKTSVEAAPSIPDESLDFVFIDAQHTYEACTEDIRTWFPKVRRGGLLTGHDYRWDGVNRAVHEFAQKMNLRGYFTPGASDVWFFQKPSSLSDTWDLPQVKGGQTA
jgi:predicted O-methyltransferase YrrM